MGEPLDEKRVASDPIEQFNYWFNQAMKTEVMDVNAMGIATADSTGRPANRVVLLKDVDERGFVFFTNYQSQKGKHLAANPRAELLFYWPELSRQVRIYGTVEKVSPEESDAYWRTRPRESQLSAWASPQSEVVSGREVLEARFKALEAQYAGKEIPRPPYWGGYRVVPDELEFWQGRPNRLHDRIRYRKEGEVWKIERLAP